MSDWKKQMSDTERRKLARIVRYELRALPQPPVAKVAADHNISRAYVYQIIEALEAWEAKATFKQEVADAFPNGVKNYIPQTWLFMSGRMVIACTHGEIDSTIFGQPAGAHQDDLLT